MDSGNIAVVKSMYDAFKRGDGAAVFAAMAQDVSWTINGREQDFPTFGPRKGLAAVQALFHTMGETMELTEFTPREFDASGDKVFVLGHYAWKIKKTGLPAASDWVQIFTIKDGKLTDYQEFTDTAVFADAYRGLHGPR